MACALAAADSAHATFEQNGQWASDWLALLAAARACQRGTGDATRAHDYATRARAALENIQPRWGAQVYNEYLARPDMQYFYKQLNLLN